MINIYIILRLYNEMKNEQVHNHYFDRFSRKKNFTEYLLSL